MKAKMFLVFHYTLTWIVIVFLSQVKSNEFNIKCDRYKNDYIFLNLTSDEKVFKTTRDTTQIKLVDENRTITDCAIQDNLEAVRCLVKIEKIRDIKDIEIYTINSRSEANLVGRNRDIIYRFKINECLDHSLERFDVKMVAADVMRVEWVIRDLEKGYLTKTELYVDGTVRRINTIGEVIDSDKKNHSYKLYGFKLCDKHEVCLKREVYFDMKFETCTKIKTMCPSEESSSNSLTFLILISLIGGLLFLSISITVIHFYSRYYRRHRETMKKESNQLIIPQIHPIEPPPLPKRPPLPPPSLRGAEHDYDRVEISPLVPSNISTNQNI